MYQIGYILCKNKNYNIVFIYFGIFSLGFSKLDITFIYE